MELLAIARLLGRHRALLLPGIVLAVLLAFALQGHPHKGTIAVGRALLTADDGPAFDLASKISVSLPARASLLADMAARDDVRRGIARRAGLDPALVTISGPAAGAPAIPVPIAVEASKAAGSTGGTFTVTTAAEPTVPLITVRATGPDPVAVARLADATRVALRALLAPARGARGAVSLAPLGPVTVRTVFQRPSPLAGVAAGLTLLLGWCAAIALSASGQGRGRRGARPGGRSPAAPDGPPAG